VTPLSSASLSSCAGSGAESGTPFVARHAWQAGGAAQVIEMPLHLHLKGTRLEAAGNIERDENMVHYGNGSTNRVESRHSRPKAARFKGPASRTSMRASPLP